VKKFWHGFIIPLLIITNVTIPIFAAKPVTLRIWHIWDYCPASRRIFEDYCKANPNIRLEIDGTEAGYDRKIKTAIAANEAPDIFFSWGGGFSEPFVRAGKVLALNDFLDDATKEKLLPGSLTNFTYAGKVYALPTTLAIGVLYCNRELFTKYGVKIPETYQELVNAVKVFNSKNILPIALMQQETWAEMFWYDALALRTAGAQLCIDALHKKASFLRPEFTAAAAKLVELVELNGFGNYDPNRDSVETIELFAQGKAAMFYDGTWSSAKAGAVVTSVKENLIALPFPLIEGGKGTITEFLGGPCDCFMVSANTKHQKEAVQALKYICAEIAKESYLAGLGLPLWKTDSIITSQLNPLIIQQTGMIKDATAFVPWWDVVLQGEAGTLHKILVQKLFNRTITPEQFVKEMQKLNQ
jgi:raffinose/stachyose/melibiose transport system substrate-binding protein